MGRLAPASSAVELAVTGPVEPVAKDHSGRGLDWRDSAELGEGPFGADSTMVGPRGNDLTRHDRSDPDLIKQLRGDAANEDVELGLRCLRLSCFSLAGERSAGGGTHGGDGRDIWVVRSLLQISGHAHWTTS